MTVDAVVADVLDAAPDRFALAGYSMGGRIALHVGLTAPERITRLVLLAATAGIDDERECAVRRIADEALAARMELDPIEDVARGWMAQPVFAGTPPEAMASWRADILRNDPAALAMALRGLGQTAAPPAWDRLGELPMPTRVLAGDRDPKYVAIGERLAAALPRGDLHVVPGVGHGLVREAPETVLLHIKGQTL